MPLGSAPRTTPLDPVTLSSYKPEEEVPRSRDRTQDRAGPLYVESFDENARMLGGTHVRTLDPTLRKTRGFHWG